MLQTAGIIGQQRRHSVVAPAQYQGKKKTGANGWNSRLVSTETIPANTAGGIKFKVISMDDIFHIAVGDATDILTYGDGALSPTVTAWYRSSSTQLRIYNNAGGANTHAAAVDDYFEIRRTAAGVFSWLKNDVSVTGPSITNTDEIYLMMTFFHTDAILDEIQIDAGSGYVGGVWDSAAALNESYYEDYP